jgi:hypothetical protein
MANWRKGKTPGVLSPDSWALASTTSSLVPLQALLARAGDGIRSIGAKAERTFESIGVVWLAGVEARRIRRRDS